MGRFLLVLIGVLSMVQLLPQKATAATPGEVEVGLDGGFDYGIVDDADDDLMRVRLPVASVRVGYMVSGNAQIEPSLGFDLRDFGDSSLWDLNLGLGLLWNLSSNGREEPFLRVHAAYDVFGGDGDSFGQAGLGAGVGCRFRHSEHWGTRLEGMGIRRFETEDLRARWDLGLRFGVSAFVK